ncbi:MAG TPA: TonB-dependent receptor [Polyangiaceae bacterium]|nr:TonB-dependent receptor [Polyangiaceae bacterium]
MTRIATRHLAAAVLALSFRTGTVRAEEVTAPATDEQTVEVHGMAATARGLGDVRVSREVLQASPRQQTSELLSAAPGFFVDHEDGEGLGNDVYLRGWDLEHGSGIEMTLGRIPLNAPVHVRGQGYVDVNFIIPEIVRSVRVLEGPYDPRQGDASIVGSAAFDLGAAERGSSVGLSYGSFNQVRLVGITAPRDGDADTFAAFSLRHTDGFGVLRSGDSGSVNAQYGFDLGRRDHVKLLATAYSTASKLPGVVRQDDVDAGRIGFYGSYPSFAGGQSIDSSRVLVAATFDRTATDGSHAEIVPWVTWTDFRARQNFAGALETSQDDPSLSGLGDLFETKQREVAAGLTTSYRMAPLALGSFGELVVEPGVLMRAAHVNQSKSLLVPDTLVVWDRRLDAGIGTLDAGAYVDLDLRLWKRLRIAGGPRADLLAQTVDDRLVGVVALGTGARQHLDGLAVSPRVTAELDVTSDVAVGASYGEGFRSVDAAQIPGTVRKPYSKVRSFETGIRVSDSKRRYRASIAAFETLVENELVFVAESGGLETEGASIRRGVVGSLLARPLDWLLASTALSVTDATFTTRITGVSHYVPSVPPVLLRIDASAEQPLGTLFGKPVKGKVGVGYTFLSGKHLTDTVIGPVSHVLNAHAGARAGAFELGVDAYNLPGSRYADDAEVYISNWSVRPGQQPASIATHLTAAPPRTVVGTLTVHL